MALSPIYTFSISSIMHYNILNLKNTKTSDRFSILKPIRWGLLITGQKHVVLIKIYLTERGEKAMEDDFSNLRNLKKSLQSENMANLKPVDQKPGTRVRFIITKNNNNSWIDDLHAQEQLNKLERVFH